MPRTADARSSPGNLHETPEKLVSWKSIASYFNCDERTAKRWEQERGLPVHRAPGDKRSAVFAYASELEAWLHSEPHWMLHHGRRAQDGESTDSADAPITGESHAGKPDGEEPRAIQAQAFPGQLHRRWVWTTTAVVVFLIGAVLVLLREEQRVATRETAEVRTRARNSPAGDSEELFLQARYFWNLRTAKGLSKAIDDFTQAIVIDPNYAEAYAGLAESYDLLPQFAHGDMAEDFERAKRAADRAIELNPNLAAAHRAKAFALFFRDWDITGSDAEFQRALALDPDSDQTHQWYASTLLNRLEGVECIRQIDEARRLDPASAAIAADLGLMHAEFGNDPKSGIRILQDLERTQPALLTPPVFMREIDFAAGDYEAYMSDLRKVAAVSHDPDDIAMADAAQHGWARAGKTGLLRSVVEVQRRAFNHGNESGFWIGRTYLVLGEPGKALPYFKLSLANHEILIMAMPDCPWAKRLTADPEYSRLFAVIRTQMRGSPAHPAVVPVTYRLPS